MRFNKSDNDIPKEQVTETNKTEITDMESEVDNTIETASVELEEVKDEVDSVESEVEILQALLNEARDKYLRLAAEFDNYRKRTLREKTELIQTAGEALLKDILPVVDDFERGLDVMEQTEDMNAVKIGINLIYNKLQDFLNAKGVKAIEVMDESFDPDRHEAITNIPASSEDKKGKVVDVIQKGYALHDKIMRYPKVVVGE